jgi:GntR family transcriptional repressor for pyruvate dehydrogenase complex
MTFQKIEKRTISQLIITQIQEKLLKGEIEVGQRLPSERRLAEMLGVGRSSVREAMRALQYMGILEIKQDGGISLR